MSDCVYEKNELAELLERKRRRYLSRVDHSNGTKGGDGCGCKKKYYINTNYTNTNYTNTNYTNTNYTNILVY